jgi:precorrin isomerase
MKSWMVGSGVKSEDYGFLPAEILCGGLSIIDSQINDNDRKQQKLIHKNIFSCGELILLRVLGH